MGAAGGVFVWGWRGECGDQGNTVFSRKCYCGSGIGIRNLNFLPRYSG